MDKELKIIITDLISEIKSLKKEVKELKFSQKLTHDNQERMFKNQVDMENKLDNISQFERYEFEELKEIESDKERDMLEHDFDDLRSPFIIKILDNLNKKLEIDKTKFSEQHIKVIKYLFSRELYDASHKKFIGVNFRKIRDGSEVNTNVIKDILIKLEEEQYIISEITSEKDKSRKNFRANVNYFKN